MKIWDVLLNINIENKERFQDIFSKTVKEVQNNTYDVKIGEIEEDDHYLITDERMNGYFIHIVPKQVYDIFKKIETKEQFLGFTVLAGKWDNKDVRVSCFGIQCNLLGKSLTK